MCLFWYQQYIYFKNNEFFEIIYNDIYFSLHEAWQIVYLCLANMYKHIGTQENQPSMFYETFTGEITEPSIVTFSDK